MLKVKKTQFTCTLDSDLIEDFKIACIRTKVKPPVVIAKLLREHLAANAAETAPGKKLSTGLPQ